jgi:plastocyanin
MKGVRYPIVAAAVAALVGVACASNSSTPPAAGSTSPAANAGGGGLYGGYGGGPSGGPSPSASAGAAAAMIQQGAGGQLVFTPATLTVKQGDVIEIADVSAIPHTFTIDGQGIDVLNSGGQSQNVTISLAPGTYPFFCRFHESSGMKGTLTVTG